MSQVDDQKSLQSELPVPAVLLQSSKNLQLSAVRACSQIRPPAVRSELAVICSQVFKNINTRMSETQVKSQIKSKSKCLQVELVLTKGSFVKEVRIGGFVRQVVMLLIGGEEEPPGGGLGGDGEEEMRHQLRADHLSWVR